MFSKWGIFTFCSLCVVSFLYYTNRWCQLTWGYFLAVPCHHLCTKPSIDPAGYWFRELKNIWTSHLLQFLKWIQMLDFFGCAVQFFWWPDRVFLPTFSLGVSIAYIDTLCFTDFFSESTRRCLHNCKSSCKFLSLRLSIFRTWRVNSCSTVFLSSLCAWLSVEVEMRN